MGVIQLTDLSGKLLTVICTEVSLPAFDLIKIENKLLDGSLHVQTIGDPLKTIKATVVTTEELAETIDQMQSVQEDCYFVKDDKQFRGQIREAIVWKKLGRYKGKSTLFSGELEFVINETN